MNKLSTAALILIALSGESQVSAFLPNFFGGGKQVKENLVQGRSNGNMDNLFGDLSFTNDSAVKKSTMTLAYKAIAEECSKFQEALLAVMSQRVQEYLQVKLGVVDDAKLNKIIKMS